MARSRSRRPFCYPFPSPTRSPASMRKWFLTSCALLAAALLAAAQENWRFYGGSQENQRFAPLDQINEQTVRRLGLVWSQELGTSRGLEATPIVEGGVIYTTGSWSVAYAFDARTGKLKWTYDPRVSREKAYFYCCDVLNRGLALNNAKAYLAPLDGRRVALDQDRGSPLWSVQTADPAKAYSITAAPLIAGNRVIIGNAGSEYGVRGYVT